MKFFSKEKPTAFHITITLILASIFVFLNFQTISIFIVLASFLPYAFRKSSPNQLTEQNIVTNEYKKEEKMTELETNSALKVIPGLIFTIIIDCFFWQSKEYALAITFLAYLIAFLFFCFAFRKNLSFKRYLILSIVASVSFISLIATLIYFFFIMGDDGPQAGIWITIFSSPIWILWLISINKDFDIFHKYRTLSKQIATEKKITEGKIHQDFSEKITPLLGAIITGDLDLVRTALADHPEQLNTAYAQNGNTPLHVAALNGYTDIIRLLLAQPGIDTTRTNNEGNTALDLANLKGHVEIAQLLEQYH